MRRGTRSLNRNRELSDAKSEVSRVTLLQQGAANLELKAPPICTW